MNALVVKEIRLLLPAFALALLLSIVPVSCFAWEWNPTFSLLCFGGLMMALTTFGREFGMGTFPLLLAMPLTRGRIWWIKIVVLGCALATLFLAYAVAVTRWGSLNIWDYLPHSDISLPQPGTSGTTVLAIAFVTIFASGLWTTLLLRQMMAAFWFALLVPAAIMTLISWNGGSVVTVEVVLGVYSLAGFGWAWRQFHRAQEVAWTGGEINLPEWQAGSAFAGAPGRNYRPFAALVWKEVQLYQVALVGMAGLFVLHLGVIAVRKGMHEGQESSVLNALFGMFGGIWLIVPLITGSLNIADERRMGTMEAQLCLPVSTRKQFTIKLLAVLVLSGFLSALLLWLAEGMAHSVNTDAGLGSIKISLNGEGLPILLAIFSGITLLIFYASTLTRSILQAMVTAAAIGCALAFIYGAAHSAQRVAELRLWDEPLLTFITWPTMMVTIIGLSYRNYCRLSDTRRLWLRNARGLLLAMLFAGTVTSLIYNRTWELLAPIEPPHGVAQLRLFEPPVFHTDNQFISVLLPDGRARSERAIYDPGHVVIQFGENVAITRGGGWVGQQGSHFLEGSNWVSLIGTAGENIGIRSDGTLWVSERPDYVIRTKNGKWVSRPPANMVRFGNDGDWKSVVADGYKAILLLKTDGTLWRWGTNHVETWTGRTTRMAPHRLGAESDWSELMSSPLGWFVWKSDGRAWKFNFQARNKQDSQITLESELGLERWETFDNIKWRSLAASGQLQLGVRDDGTLWTFGGTSANYQNVFPNARKQPVPIGTGRDWVSVAGDFGMLVALKADGTLWRWNTDFWGYGPDWPLAKPPVRLGTHNDWVAISGEGGNLATLAADGSIWYWSSPWGNYSWLAPSRRPLKFDNIFAQ